MIQVTKNVYVETGMFACNLGFVTTSEGIVMIDTPMRPTDAVKWRDEVSRRGEIKFLINTEEHADHWQGSWFMPGVLITHQTVRDKLLKVPMDEVTDMVEHTDPEGMALMKGYRVRTADITFTEDLNLYLGSHTIRLFHLPGHSDGGIGVYIPEERVVFTTDIVFHKFKSFLNESDPARWLESLEKLGELEADTVVPGHGAVCDKDYLEEQAGIVRQWAEAVQAAVKQGLSEEEAAASIVCLDPHQKQPGTPMTPAELDRAIVARLYKIYSR